jgi:HAD superfamily hydrolase (TIGR01490 family)
MTNAPVSLSVFDVDRTITRLPTYTMFLLTSAWFGNPLRLLLIPALIPFAIAHAARRITRRQLKMVMHGLMLGRRVPRAKAAGLAERFARRIYADGLYAEARRRIREEQSAGRRVVVATAAPDLYIRPLAALLGIDDVVATRCSWEGGDLLTAIDGENCYGRAKRDMLRDYLSERGISRASAHIRFFSDHASDLPVFEWVDEPIAVNPCPKLATIARARNWPQQDWKASEATLRNVH